MLLNHTQTAPKPVVQVLSAAEAAARAIPPCFPLNATVAVNPFLGQTHLDLAHASARLSRVAGVGLVLLIGHGARFANNPHESAYQCGACCGQTGEISARLLATLLNDPETRAGLPARA